MSAHTVGLMCSAEVLHCVSPNSLISGKAGELGYAMQFLPDLLRCLSVFRCQYIAHDALRDLSWLKLDQPLMSSARRLACRVLTAVSLTTST